jgi:hypothetical protein
MDCFLCCVFSVLYCSVTLYCSVLLFFLCVLYCSFFLYCTVSACNVGAATTTEVFRAFSSVVRQMPGYNSQRRGTTAFSKKNSFNFLLLRMFLIFYSYLCSVLCILCIVCICVLLQLGVNPTAVKYTYHNIHHTGRVEV